jgi:hypothetical protein
MAIKVSKWTKKHTNILHSKAQIGIFGLKINHLATLIATPNKIHKNDDFS